MKQALQAILINSIAIAVVALFLPGIQYGNQLSTLIITAIVLGIANTFIRPVLALILLPINVITLGLAGLFMNAILLFIVTLLVPNFNIIPFTLNLGTSPISVSLIFSYIISSFILSFVSGIIRRIINS